MENTGKHGMKKKKGRLRNKIIAAVIGVFAAGLIAVIVMTSITALKIGKINRETLYANIEQSSVLYDINGDELDTLHYTQDRKIVSIKDMPDDLKNAFIAIEDKTFYKHHGFNFRRMIGAVVQSILHRSSISGTSTITQQLARNAYLADIKSQRSIRRKLSEMYIAWQLERSLTKDQILEAYLNTIYLGYGNYGVNAAARTYFSKDVSELDLAECAALAALPQAPDTYAFITSEKGEGRKKIKNIKYYTLNEIDDDEDEEEQSGNRYTEVKESEEDKKATFYSNDASKERRDTVLSLMEKQGYISKSEADKATLDITDILSPSFEKSESAYRWFTDYVAEAVTKDLMEEYRISDEEALRMVYTGGLKIHTTLNKEMQDIIYDEFQDDSNFPSAENDAEVQASMVVTEVGTGYISAMVGGRDAGGSQLYNRAINPRQPGSSIKPFSVYGAALQKSFEYAEKGEKFKFTDFGYDSQGDKYWGDYITASSTVIDERMTVDGKEWPQNATRSYSGRRTVRTALQQSINTCAVKILWQVGLDYAMDMLNKFDISTVVSDTKKEVNDNNPAALALGAMAYGVTPLDMSLAYAAFPNDGVKNTAVCYTEVLDSSDRIMLTGKSEEKKVLDEGVAWIMTDMLKTVVSEGIARNASIQGIEVGGKTGTTNDWYDVWFDGFTPEYSGALWIGTDKNVKMNGTSAQAALLWSKIMSQVPDIKECVYSEKPDNVIEKNGEYYTEGTEGNAGYRYSGPSNDDKQEEEDEDDEEEEPEIPVETEEEEKEEKPVVKPEKPDTGGGKDDSGSGDSSDSGDSGPSGGTDSTDSGDSGESGDPGSGSGGTDTENTEG